MAETAKMAPVEAMETATEAAEVAETSVETVVETAEAGTVSGEAVELGPVAVEAAVVGTAAVEAGEVAGGLPAIAEEAESTAARPRRSGQSRVLAPVVPSTTWTQRRSLRRRSRR